MRSRIAIIAAIIAAVAISVFTAAGQLAAVADPSTWAHG